MRATFQVNFPLKTSVLLLEEAETGSFSLTDVVSSESTSMSAVTRMESLTVKPELGSKTMPDWAKSHHPWDRLLAENLRVQAVSLRWPSLKSSKSSSGSHLAARKKGQKTRLKRNL